MNKFGKKWKKGYDVKRRIPRGEAQGTLMPTTTITIIYILLLVQLNIESLVPSTISVCFSKMVGVRT